MPQARVLFNFFHELPPTTLTVNVNGHAHSVPWPYPDNFGYIWRTYAVTIPVTDLVAGTNVVAIGADQGNYAPLDRRGDEPGSVATGPQDAEVSGCIEPQGLSVSITRHCIDQAARTRRDSRTITESKSQAASRINRRNINFSRESSFLPLSPVERCHLWAGAASDRCAQGDTARS
jgi:hypothetical protein